MVFACKWLSIGEALVKDRAERPDVATLVCWLPAKLFRRHVGKCPEQTTALSLGGIHDARDPEVHDFDGAIRGDHDVSRLDITMNHPAAVSVIKCAASLDDVAELLRDGQRQTAGDHLFETFSVQVLHGDKRRAFRFGEFVDGDDIGMLQQSCGLGFAMETLEEIRVICNARGDGLDGDGPPNERVTGLEDDTHGSPAEFAHDLVSADMLQK